MAAVVTARALEVGFRHLPQPLRWWQGPDTVTVGSGLFVRGSQIELPESAAPSWSKTEPTGFTFAYLLSGAVEAAAFFQHGVENVPVTLHKLFRGLDGLWVEQAAWRFQGVVSGATWAASAMKVTCPVVPLSRTARFRPSVGLWSHRSQLAATDGADTGLRWFRGVRRLVSLVPADVGE